MGITFKRLRQSAVKRAEGFRSFGGDSCQVTRQQHMDLYLRLFLKPPRTIDGVIKTHTLWSQPPGSPDRCAKDRNCYSHAHGLEWCWGGSFIKPHSTILSRTERVNLTPPGLVLCIKPNYMSCVQGEMDFSLGALNISVIFTFITQEDLIPELSLAPPPLTNTPFQHVRLLHYALLLGDISDATEGLKKASEATFVFPNPLMLESFPYHAWMILQSNILSRALCKQWF